MWKNGQWICIVFLVALAIVLIGRSISTLVQVYEPAVVGAAVWPSYLYFLHSCQIPYGDLDVVYLGKLNQPKRLTGSKQCV